MIQYSSKLLLFGEHTINRGSNALAIPYPAFGGEWKYSKDTHLQQNLSGFADYLENLQKQNALKVAIDIDAFRDELTKGLYFYSNIPVGYGLGSSGALCAAVYNRFCSNKVERTDSQHFTTLKQDLAQMESFFHGASSGTDPLICYLNQPILIKASGAIEIVALPLHSELTFFLLDTGMPRSTGPLVKFFLKSCEEQAFLAKVNAQLVWHNKEAIAAFLNGNEQQLFENISEISRFQLEELPGMTPEKFHSIWKEGLEGNLFRLKMCGAGGGGFILGVTFDWQQTQTLLENYKLLKINF